jgi:hypothetical protein
VRRDRRGVRVDVEVEARVFEHASTKPGPRRAEPAPPSRRRSSRGD